jgi:hypothetical protein
MVTIVRGPRGLAHVTDITRANTRLPTSASLRPEARVLPSRTIGLRLSSWTSWRPDASATLLRATGSPASPSPVSATSDSPRGEKMNNLNFYIDIFNLWKQDNPCLPILITDY